MIRGENLQPKIAVTYVRVSSAAQVAKGQGAESQAARCEDYARHKGYKVVKTFADRAVSGALIERPAMKELLAYVRKHRKTQIRILIDDISRLARGLEAHLALRAAIAEAGGILESPSVEFGEDSDSQLIENLLASVSQHQRGKNAEQTRNRMEARMRRGYYTFYAPWGFKYQKKAGHGNVLVRDEPMASILQEGMEGYASGRFQTQAEVARFFQSRPDFPKDKHGKVKIDRVKRVLTTVLYAGMIEHPAWNIKLMKAHHDGLVSFETFQKIQERLKGKAYVPSRPDISEHFPVRGAVTCHDCGHPLTACFSKSKTGKRHPDYICHHKPCVSYRKSIRRADLEGAVEDMLKALKPSKTMFAIIRDMFSDAWGQQHAHAKDIAKSLGAELSKVEKQIDSLLDRIVEATNERVIAAYEKRIESLETQKLVLAERAQITAVPRRSFEEMFELTLKFLANPYTVWKNGNLKEKKMVLRLVLTDRLSYCRKTGLRTPIKSSVFNILKGENMREKWMAETKGFEPSIPF